MTGLAEVVVVNWTSFAPLCRTAAELDAAQNREEFICEGPIQTNFLVDKSGVIHPVLGNLLDLSTVTGVGSDLLCP